MDAERSKKTIQPALVLTWNGTTARILCPYRCTQKIHSHGTTMPREGVINSRAAHCVHDSDSCSREYRLVYPFEIDEAIHELSLWWELDRERGRWRTVGWNVYDPEYENLTEMQGNTETEELGEAEHSHSESPPRNIFDSEPGNIGNVDENELSSCLAGMNLNNHDLNDTKAKRKEIGRFVAFCVTNEEELARAMINCSPNRAQLVQESITSDGKTALHMACEEGHIKIVNLLLEHGSLLEERDSEGNTPLLSAINYGRSDVVSRLIQAGATTTVVSKDGKSFVDKVREALKLQEISRKFNQRMIDAPLTNPERVPLEKKPRHKVFNEEGICTMEYIIDDEPFY